jgi:hypothetical protein
VGKAKRHHFDLKIGLRKLFRLKKTFSLNPSNGRKYFFGLGVLTQWNQYSDILLKIIA